MQARFLPSTLYRCTSKILWVSFQTIVIKQVVMVLLVENHAFNLLKKEMQHLWSAITRRYACSNDKLKKLQFAKPLSSFPFVSWRQNKRVGVHWKTSDNKPKAQWGSWVYQNHMTSVLLLLGVMVLIVMVCFKKITAFKYFSPNL